MTNQRIKWFYYITIFGICIMILATLIAYPYLPDQIPVHFCTDGTPNRYSDKISIWLLPILIIATCLAIRFFAKQIDFDSEFAKLPNSARKNPEVKEKYIKPTYEMMWVTNPTLVIGITYVYIETLLVSLGYLKTLSTFGLYFCIGIIILPTIIYLYKYYKLL